MTVPHCPPNADGHHTVLREQLFHHCTADDLPQGLRVTLKVQIQLLRQFLPVFIVAFYIDHFIQTVHPQLQRGVDIDTDLGGGGKVEPTHPCQQAQQAQPAPHRQGKVPISAFLPPPHLLYHKGHGPCLQFPARLHLIKRLFQPIIHGPHLPAFPEASVWSGSGVCERY